MSREKMKQQIKLVKPKHVAKVKQSQTVATYKKQQKMSPVQIRKLNTTARKKQPFITRQDDFSSYQKERVQHPSVHQIDKIERRTKEKSNRTQEMQTRQSVNIKRNQQNNQSNDTGTKNRQKNQSNDTGEKNQQKNLYNQTDKKNHQGLATVRGGRKKDHVLSRKNLQQLTKYEQKLTSTEEEEQPIEQSMPDSLSRQRKNLSIVKKRKSLRQSTPSRVMNKQQNSATVHQPASKLVKKPYEKERISFRGRKAKTQKQVERMKQVIDQVFRWLKNPILLIKPTLLVVLTLVIMGLFLGVVNAIQSLVPSFFLKNEAVALSQVWEYVTDLDAEKTLSIQKGQEAVTINGSSANKENVQLLTTIDPIIGYFDGLYGEYSLQTSVKPAYFKGKTIQEELANLHGQLIQSTSKNQQTDIQLTEAIDYFSDEKTFSQEIREQFDLLYEIGQYKLFEELLSPIPSEQSLEISRRYGYFVLDGEKKKNRGIRIQGKENQTLVAPMTGELIIKNQSVTIEGKQRKLTLDSVDTDLKSGTQIEIGDSLGQIANGKEFTISYEMNGKVVNPAFFFPEVRYLESTNFGYQGANGAFNESLFRFIIQTKGHAFRDKADKIIAEAKKAGVSPVIFAAIMIHESAWGTSQAIRELNNPAGLMTSSGLMSFKTLDEGIEATGRTLHNLIVDRELHTVEALGSVYCPVGASNDPLGLNVHWVPTIKSFLVELGGTEDMSLLWRGASGKAGEIIEQAESLYQKGVIYTQEVSRRGSFPYFDCSAFVNWALRQAGFDVQLGGTEYMFGLEGTILRSIPRDEVQAGDLFIWGTKGSSGGDYGHTGIFLDDGKTIIHCTPSVNQGGNVVKTPFEGYYGNASLAPVQFYRVME
ncbi:hypothetical protein BH739_04660 [Enterococcus casseliflavus]|nr:hypothetical protein BH739_04660 [Enterococcus casseliflavus]